MPSSRRILRSGWPQRFGLAPLDDHAAAARESELNLRAPRIKPPDALAAICSTGAHDRAGHSYGRGYRDIVRAFRRDYPNPFDVVAFPRDEAELARVLEWCDEERIAATPYGGGSSVVGGVEPPARRRLARLGVDRSDPPRPRARSRPRLARRAHPGRRARSRARGPVAPARLHAASLPAVVRVLHARRMDRDALGRPFRDALHPYRRFRGITARAHADRRRRVAPPARLGRRSESGPHVHRLGGNPRHHHGGLDAPAGPAEVSRRRVGRVRRLPRRRRTRCARSRRPVSIRPTAACSTRARRPTPAPARATTPCWCWRSSRPTMRSSRG